MWQTPHIFISCKSSDNRIKTLLSINHQPALKSFIASVFIMQSDMLYIWVYTCNHSVLVFVPSSWHYFSFVYSSKSFTVCMWLCLWREIPVVWGPFLWGLCQQAAVLWERAVFRSHRTVFLLIINSQMTSNTRRQKRGTSWFTSWFTSWLRECVCV